MQILAPLGFHCAGPHKTRLRRSKFAFRLRETVAGKIFWCLAAAPWRFSFIWPRLLVDTRRVSRGQICVASRQVKICVSPARNTRSDCFPCAGPQKTRLRRSKCLRRATKSDDKDATNCYDMNRRHRSCRSS